jgi:hypothetical protein
VLSTGTSLSFSLTFKPFLHNYLFNQYKYLSWELNKLFVEQHCTVLAASGAELELAELCDQFCFDYGDSWN